MNPALLLIDYQNDYFPNGRMECRGSTEAALNARRVLTSFRDKGLPVIHVQHISIRRGATFLLPETEGVEIHESVKPLPEEMLIQKNYPSSFRDTQLSGHLREIGAQKLVVCGMMTHMCVDSTVRAAFDYGFKTILVSDACATKDLTCGEVTVPAEFVQAAFIAALGAVFSLVMTVDEFLAELDWWK
jgi:nicotinamidase-related amidase